MSHFVSATVSQGVTHGFLTGPRPVFGSYHAPQGTSARNIAYVLCPPHGWEGIQFYETIHLLAKALAAAGFPTLRLHYDGTGESFGTDEDPNRVDAWTESIRSAVKAMAKLPGVEHVGLVAVRMAALLAGKVASEGDGPEIAKLVLWEPCVTGASYTREMEILASASPRAAQKEGDAGTSYGVEAGGYVLTRDTVAELGTIDLVKTTPRGKPDVLMICRDDRPPIFAKKLVAHLEGQGLAAMLEQLPGYKEAMTYPEKAKPGVAMIDRIRDWAVEHSQAIAGDAKTESGLALAPEGVVGSTRRRPIRFGPANRIFGVLTEPTTRPSTPKTPVLLLTGGVVPRISVNRMYVVLAERLAAMGHTVLRPDVSGICESPPAEGLPANDPHASTLLGDVKNAVELLVNETGSDTITLLGLCSGAYASFQTALTDPRVRNIVLLNPEVFHLKDGTPKFSQTEQSHAANHYRQSLLDPEKWKKLLTGKANVRYIAGFVVAKAKTTIETAKERIEARITKVPQGLAGDLHRFANKGVKVTVVMAHGDSGYESLMSQLSADLEALKGIGFRLELTPGPDHTFNDFSTREPLIEKLVEILDS